MPNEEQPISRNTDERIDAISMNLELLVHEVSENARAIERNARAIDKLTKALGIDAENIRALARIAEAHEERISEIERPRKK